VEMTEKESYQEELKWLLEEDMENGRKLCSLELLCAPEGICVPCGLTTIRVKELDRVCEEFGEKVFYVDLETTLRTTTEEAVSTTQAAGEDGVWSCQQGFPASLYSLLLPFSFQCFTVLEVSKLNGMFFVRKIVID